MVSGVKRLAIAGCAALLVCAAWIGSRAQAPSRSASGGAAGSSPEAERAVIERQALRLIDPRTLHVPLQLVPVRSVELTAETDGFVRSVRIQTGQRLEAQEEAARLDAGEEQLLVDRARAALKVAEIELRTARDAGPPGQPAQAELATARLEVAKADLALANLRLERTIVRAPFAGRTLRTNITPGAYVRAGQPLATLGDTRQLKVEIPVDRGQVAVGRPIEIRVEDRAVQGSVTEILPLAERFEPLRTVLHSVASAMVVIENADGQFEAGQTVYAAAIPRDPVAEVPTATLSNVPDGGRRVQVLRGDVVRDVEVQLLSQVGVERIYVSGSFAEGDELVLASSPALADGTRVRASTPAVPSRATESTGASGATRPLPPAEGGAPVPRPSRF